MNNLEIRKRVFEAYDNLIDEAWVPGWRFGNKTYENRVRQRGKYESCGRTLTVPRTGHTVRYFCRSPLCPDCANYWGRKLARRFVDRYPDAAHDDFMMFTGMLGITCDLDEGFSLPRQGRTRCTNVVNYQRRHGYEQAEWRSFGIAGALEIDCFHADQFKELGNQKQAQYRDKLGFDPTTARGLIWVPTIHGIVHVGKLGHDTIKTKLKSVFPVIHLQSLYDWQSLGEASQNVVGYGSKVMATTSLAFGQSQEWPLDALQEYIAACGRNSRGRQGFRFWIGPKLPPKSSPRHDDDSPRYDDDDAMPVVLW